MKEMEYAPKEVEILGKVIEIKIRL